MASEGTVEGRGHWGSAAGFVLAAAGSAVGLGNIWKFPYIAWENHGGAFVLVYLVCIALIGLPIMTAEILLGRRATKDPVGTFRMLGGAKWTWVGWLGVATGFIILSYYAVVAGWTLHYTGLSVLDRFRDASAGQVGDYFGGFVATGWMQVLYSGLFMAVTVGIVMFGVHRGIERAAQILMPILFVFLVVLVVGAARLDGAGEAFWFLFRPNFGGLTMNGLLEAVGHSFFTLSLGMGAMITYGSYLRSKSNIPANAVTISLLDTIVALTACGIIFPILFTWEGLEPSESAGILFTSLPHVFTEMGGLGRLFGPIFFLLVCFAALTSAISLLEVCVAYVIDERGWSRKAATLAMGGAIFGFGIFSALSFGAVELFSTDFNPLAPIFGEARAGVFVTLDYLASNWLLPLGGMFIAIFTGWTLSSHDKMEELRKGSNIPGWMVTVWTWLLRVPAPLAILLILWGVVREAMTG